MSLEIEQNSGSPIWNLFRLAVQMRNAARLKSVDTHCCPRGCKCTPSLLEEPRNWSPLSAIGAVFAICVAQEYYNKARLDPETTREALRQLLCQENNNAFEQLGIKVVKAFILGAGESLHEAAPVIACMPFFFSCFWPSPEETNRGVLYDCLGFG